MASYENKTRALRAYETIQDYKETRLGESGECGPDDAADLLADLFHHFGEQTLDELVLVARDNFRRESALIGSAE